MAYALLCNVEPIVGLYMGFFPVIMYTILGTSRHVSIGKYICIMLQILRTLIARYKMNILN